MLDVLCVLYLLSNSYKLFLTSTSFCLFSQGSPLSFSLDCQWCVFCLRFFAVFIDGMVLESLDSQLAQDLQVPTSILGTSIQGYKKEILERRDRCFSPSASFAVSNIPSLLMPDHQNSLLRFCFFPSPVHSFLFLAEILLL